VSLDVEGFLYTRAKQLGVTLITVSHRPSLWKFHEKVLKFDGNGGFEFREMEPQDIPPVTYTVAADEDEERETESEPEEDEERNESAWDDNDI